MGETNGETLVAEALRLLRLGVEPASVADAGPARAPLGALLDFAASRRVTGPVARGLRRAGGGVADPGAAFLVTRILEEEERHLAALTAQADEMIAGFAAAGIEPMFLKGGAQLLAAGFAPEVWRPMVDFDILVREGDLDRAAGVMASLGYEPYSDNYVAGVDHHLPAYVRDGDIASVEIHDSLGWVRCPAALGLEAVWRESLPAPRAAGPARVPSPMHRAAHVVVHSQITDHNHDRRMMRLRDAVDWRLLTATGAIDIDELDRRFHSDGYREEFRAFVSLMCAFWQEAERPAWAARYDERNRTVLRGLAEPSSLRKYLVVDVLRIVLASLFDRRRFRRLAASLLDPERRRLKLDKLIAGFRR